MYLKEIPCINKVTIPYHTEGYKMLQGVTRGHRGLQGGGLQGVTGGCNGLQGVTGNYKGLPGGCKGL